MGGVKVQIVYPTDERVQKIRHAGIPGSVEGYLANFGKYQYGTSINTQVYRPSIHKNACERMR